MTLEDFFTLTEIKDGFTTLARVDELISVMQKEISNAIKNIGDAARQWSTVAGVLTATENKTCLNHFIQLDGLQFLNQWLQEAQKCTDDSNKNFVEESIDSILGALEKLPVDTVRLNVSGIRVTVERLVASADFKVQERAKTLYDSWGLDANKDGLCLVVGEKISACDEALKSSPDSEVAHKGNGGRCQEDSCGNKIHHLNTSRDSDVSEVAVNKDIEVSRSNQGCEADTPPGEGNLLGSTAMSSSSQKGSSSVVEESNGEGKVSAVTNGPPTPMEDNVGNRSVEVSELKDVSNDKKHTVESSSCRSSRKELCVGSVPSDSKGTESCARSSTSSAEPCSEQTMLDHQLKNVSTDMTIKKYASSGIELKSSRQGGDSYSKSNEVLAVSAGVKMLVSGSDLKGTRVMDSILFSGSFKPKVDTKDVDKIERRRTEMELDYGEDALEVARLVAKEVEREVVDYREPSCGSSSEKNSEGEITQPCSPDSDDEKHDDIMLEQEKPNESPVREDLSDEGGSKIKRLRLSGETDSEPVDGNNDLESTQSAGPSEELGGNADKSKCDFDLNEEVFNEEMEEPVEQVSNQPSSTLSAPIPLIPSSKGVSNLPVTRLDFEGELGWRGSAATSAFRAPSPRRTVDGDKSCLGDNSSQGSKQRHLKIDLNVAEGDEDPVVDLGSVKQVPVSSGLPSGESSVEVSSKKAERLKLDLNRLGDNEEANPFVVSDRRVEGRLFQQLHQNRHRSPSPASSSSSRQPSMRDFDLNDNPSFFDASGFQDSRRDLGKLSTQENRPYGGFRLDDPIVSIMGSRQEIERKDFIHRGQGMLPNGQGAETSFGGNMMRVGGGTGVGLRPMLAYNPSTPPTFGYNGLGMTPSMSFSQMYGPASTPYMVDSRGGTVIPQIVGSAAGVSQPFSRPPFLMSVSGPPSGMNGFEPARAGLDLNSGMTPVEGDGRDMGALRHLFVQRHGVLMEDQIKPGLQPGGAGMSLKRKEPECGWELNMVGYKQETPWHR
ncbi:hypothetical protein H6P81_018512 [Aristolochia fimbriata]|uniref:TFIIS N-terminal domain-containing protein n=1 Tax=Aristolochia fimbriata TaxID=158543 RepID=A0AAV7E1K3_ARIFI|nr:hypothetical protein H6P81_018512 [Aristolochia fimbriata]